jgi:hypothetical protein
MHINLPGWRIFLKYANRHPGIGFHPTFFTSVQDTQSKDRLATKDVLTKQFFSRTMYCTSIRVGTPWFTIEPFPI